jgi:hypothetical protein
MSAPYTVVRETSRRNYVNLFVIAPGGVAVKHFADSQAAEAEALRDLLNAAYAEGQRSCARREPAAPAFMGNRHY